MKKMLICAAAAAGLAAGAFADRVRAVHPRYDIGSWHTTASAWEDGFAPDAGKDYVIDSNASYKADGSAAYGIRFGGASDSANVFAGKSLQIGVSGGSQVRLIYNCNGTYRISFPRDGLVLENGFLCAWSDATAIGIDGKVTVTAPKSSPFVIEGQKSTQNWDLTGPLVSSGSAGLFFRRENSSSSTSVPTLWFGFDGSEYLGDITVGWESAYKSRNATTGVSFRDNASCAGHIVLNPSLGNGIKFQSTTTAYTNGSMTVHGNQALTVNNNGSRGSGNVNSILVVTNSFTVDEGTLISVAAGNAAINNWGQYSGNATTMPFLTVPLDSNVAESNFVPVYTNTSAAWPPFVPRHDILMTVDGGTKTFALRRRTYFMMENTGIKNPISGRTDLFTFWNKDRESDYFNAPNAERTYETPNVENAEYVAKSLVLHSTNHLCIVGRTLSIPDLRLIGSSQLFVKSSGSYANTVLRGRFGVWNRTTDGKKVVALAGCAASSVRANLEIAADVWGPGDLEVKPTGNGKDGTLSLSGDNSKWTGGVSVEGNASQSIFLKAASAGALGAPLAAFRADAVELKPYGYLTAADADSLAARTVVEKPWKGFSADVKKRANGDGTVTLVAEVSHTGMSIIVF